MGDVRDARLFDVDAFNGTTEYFHYNPDDDSFVIQSQQDITPLLELNLALRNDAPERWGEWTRVASLPAVIVAQLKKDGILDDPARLRKWLNDSDNRPFRTRGGVV